MSALRELTPCPVVVSVNLDVETLDAQNAGAAGLFGRYSYGRYGAREGVWRLLNAFQACNVPATFFVSADDAIRHPDLLRAVQDGGHEIGAQGNPVDSKAPSGPAALQVLADARDALAAITGEAPSGWRSSNGLLTRDAMMELARLGYSYDSSFQDDDRPYAFDGGQGRVLVELPVFDFLTDATFYGGRHTPQRVRTVWFEEFEAMRDAGCYIHLTLHSRGDTGSGRAVRAAVVADFLTHLARQPDVRFYRCDELARLHADQAIAEPIPDWPMG